MTKTKKVGIVLLGLIVGCIGYTLADDLANVALEYCDTANNALQYHIDPGAKTGICYTLSNGAKTAVTIKLGFIDGTFTNDQRQNKACLSDTDVENFGKYVTEYDQLITLKPGETIRKKATMQYPEGSDGIYHGCVVYSIVDTDSQSKSNAGNFTILMRRAKFIDVIVGDPANAQEKGIILEDFTDADGENLSRNPKIRIYKDTSDDKYIIQLKVKNVSLVGQDVVITGVASNILTYKNTFVENRKILKGESFLVTRKIDATPIYNLKIKFGLSNTPFVWGDEVPKIGTLKTTTTIWIWNIVTYLTLVGILILAGIIFLLIQDLKRKKEKRISSSHTSKKVPTKKK